MRSILLALAATLSAATIGAQTDARSALLVTPQWLTTHLNDPKLVLLHIGDHGEYLSAHIPGARYAEMGDVASLHDMTPKVRSLEMPSPEELRQQIQRLGISNDSRIVIYFGKDWVSPATRILLTLDYAGLGSATSLLDGGMPAWVAAGGKTTAEIPATHEGKLAELKLKPVVVTGEWVRDNATKPGYALIDARAAGFYDGVMEGGPPSDRRKGHIPGAKNVPFTSPYTDKNELRPASELREMFAKAGVKPGDTIVGYCHIGQQATAMLFAARSLGYKTVLYDGSFEDWAYNGWPVELPPKSGGGAE